MSSRLDCFPMVNDSIGFSLEDISDGQSQLAFVLKKLVDKTNPALFELLDLNNDQIFLEPLLFAYFNSEPSPISLEQILVGYVEHDKKPTGVEVWADLNGIVQVPGIGDLSTDHPNEKLVLSWDSNSKACILKLHDKRIDFELKSPIRIEGTNVDLCRHNHPLLNRYYTDPDGNVLNVEVTHRADNPEQIGKSFQIIQACCPDYYQEITEVARRIILFRNDRIRPFVTIAAHGTVFLSSNEKCDEVFFLAEIIHQFGHNILNAVLFETNDYFRIDPEDSLAAYTGNASDHRTVLSAFHGLYTTTKIAECFEIIFDKKVFRGKQQHELLGRLADNADRVSSGLEEIDRKSILTERGELLYQRMEEICQGVYTRKASLLANLDTSNQPFVFDYDLFLERNPLPWPDSSNDEQSP